MPCMLLPAIVLVAVAVLLFAAVAGRCRIRTHQAGVRQRNWRGSNRDSFRIVNESSKVCQSSRGSVSAAGQQICDLLELCHHANTW